MIAGATVSATSALTNIHYESTTNNAGEYYLTNLHSGTYRIEAEKTDFKTFITPDVVVHVHDALQLDFIMAPGASSQSITVESSAAPVNAETGNVSTVIDRSFLENLPVNGRSFQNLFQLAPGVAIATTGYNDQGQFHVNGQRADANYFTVDGVSANFGVAAGALGQSGAGALPSLTASGGFNGLVSVDAVQEFRIQTSTFGPEYGRMPGAQIEFSTRSGTNQFHGTMFDYFRNDKLDANDWFANQQREPRPEERQNDFGGVLGGPIIKGNTFFFVSWESLRLGQPMAVTAAVPDQALRSGAPSALQPVLAAYPVPNGRELGGGLAQFTASLSSPTNLDAGSVRIDHTFGKVSLFGRFSDAPSSARSYPGSPFAPSNVQFAEFDSLTATAGATWLISPETTNDFRFNYSRSRAGSRFELTTTGGAAPLAPSLILPSFANPGNANFTFYCCSFGSELVLGANAANSQRQFNEVDNLTWTRGAHRLKFGIDERNLSPVFGRRAYDNQFLYLTAASVLSNTPAAVYVDDAGGATGLRAVTNNLSMFAQDTWRASRRLTLTYGLRWEYNPAPSVANRDAPWVVDQVTDLAATRLVSSGAPLWHATAANFAPRVGLAYRLSDSSHWATVLRGGAGIFYDTGFGQLGDVFAINAQYYGQTVYTTNVAFPLTLAQQTPPPLAGPPLPISQAAVFDPALKLPYTVQWNWSMEQRLGSQQTLTASWVGAAGRRLLLEKYYANPDPSFQTLIVTNNGATSDYEALQIQFRRQMSQRLEALASYTWSHSIDTASSDAYVLAASPGRASSNFDIRHSATGALTYNIPAPQTNQLARVILGHSSVDGMTFARTAEALSVLSTSTITGGSYTDVFANLQPGVPLFQTDPDVAGGKRINPEAFAAPSAGQTGNAPRNLLRGFGAWQSDLDWRRQFSLSDRVQLQFHADFFNIFNHPNFGNPVNTLSSRFFGISESMLGQSLGSGGAAGGFAPLYQIGGPRSIQLAMKLQF